MLPVGLGTGVLYTDEMIDMPPEVGDTRARGTEVIMFIIQKRRLQAFLSVRVRTRPQSGFRYFLQGSYLIRARARQDAIWFRAFFHMKVCDTI